MIVTTKRVVLVVAAAVAIFFGGGLGRQAQAAEYPKVSDLKAFSAEANHMSLAGYLRYLVFQENGQWLSYNECVRIVKQQG